MTGSHDETVKREFAKQAESFGRAGLTLSSADILAWIVEGLAPQAQWDVLDVATGTGHLGRALAPHVRRVEAVDLTDAMLAEGHAAAAAAGLGNIEFRQGNAAALPFPDGAFDLVCARLAIHHFADPPIQVAEMARVAAPGGRVALIDLVAPDDIALAESYNRLERMRDPSHVRALSPAGLCALFAGAGLDLISTDAREVEVDVGPWAAVTRTPPEVEAAIRAELGTEIDGGAATGMRPFVRDGRLHFRQTWMIAVAGKPDPASGLRGTGDFG